MNYTERLEILVSNLKKSEKLHSYDKEKESAAETVAHALLDMEDSFKGVVEQISNLQEISTEENNVDEILLGIGEELRHILYHINDMRFYDYLKIKGE